MVGLKFQDDAAAFDDGLSAFIAGLGDAPDAGKGGALSGSLPHRQKGGRRRRPFFARRRGGLSIPHRPRDSVGRSREETHGEAVAQAPQPALSRLRVSIAGLARALGFEVINGDSSLAAD
jgi:hypothetical protein